MRAAYTMDVIALSWVRGGLDEELLQLRQALEDYSSDAGHIERLSEARAAAHRIYGVLGVLHAQPARLLLRELEVFFTSSRAERADESALEPYIQAILQLEVLLDRLQTGQPVPLAALTDLVNDMRAVRELPVLSLRELTLDMALLERLDDTPVLLNADREAEVATARRAFFEKALLGWFQGRSGALDELSAVFQELEAAAQPPELRLFWGLGIRLVAALGAGHMVPSAPVKALFGRVNRLIKLLSNEGLARLDISEVRDLSRMIVMQMLEGVQFENLPDILRPIHESLAHVPVDEDEEAFIGLDRGARRQVASVLREEIAHLQDVLDIFVRGKRTVLTPLISVAPRLRQIGEIFAMLELMRQGEVLIQTSNTLDAIGRGERPLEERDLMVMAGALMRADVGVDQYELMGGAGNGEEQVLLSDASVIKAVEAIASNSLDDILLAKEILQDGMLNAEKQARLPEARELVLRAQRVFGVIGLETVRPLLSGIVQFVDDYLIEQRRVPGEMALNALADLFGSVEYYLENLRDYRQELSGFLTVGFRSLAQLGYTSDREGRSETVRAGEAAAAAEAAAAEAAAAEAAAAEAAAAEAAAAEAAAAEAAAAEAAAAE
ncbi:MAG: Hpt domain-containing protein, partial [Pseudomonadota bacterium]